ncbi:MAG: ACT domain-containing protein [Oscillospiraceae bacterium]|jgi:ACT domain-containing protein|nr:ACT domain-containing protein [Oscillospiraceae bacterium]
MKAIVTVIGLDRTGIIAEICSLLASHDINILDISQTVMKEFFTMTMLVDTALSPLPFDALSAVLSKKGEEMKLNIRIQREDIFHAMHKI